jgi:hypothetical protein
MTKQDATIVLRFHAPDSTEGGGSSICYTAGASVRMQKLCNQETSLSWTIMLTLANIDTPQFLVNNLSRTK